MNPIKKQGLRNLVITGDGSTTLFFDQYKSTYHSSYGAMAESQLVYIENGLKWWLERNSTHCRVFEVGFGTGLNAFLASELAVKLRREIHYTSIEKYPLLPEEYTPLQFGLNEEEKRRFEQLNNAEWNKDVRINDFFTLNKMEADLVTFEPEGMDVIFYDAFGPENQPEMWSEQVVSAVVKHLHVGGIVVTFCVKGTFRRCLEKCGLYVIKRPGPPGKREILQAFNRIL